MGASAIKPPKRTDLTMEMTDIDIQGSEEHVPPAGELSNARPRTIERKSNRTLNPLADRPTRRLLHLSMISIYCLFILSADIIFIMKKAQINSLQKAGEKNTYSMERLAMIPTQLIWELLGSSITLLCCLAVIFFYETDLIVMGRDFFAEEFFHFLAGSLFVGSIVFWASGSAARVDSNTKFIVTTTTTRVVYTSFQILLLCGELLSPLFNNENLRFLVRSMLNFYVAFDEFLGLLYLAVERSEIWFLVAVTVIWATILAGVVARLAHVSVRRLIRFPLISIGMFIGAVFYIIAMCINADEVELPNDVNFQTALRFYLVTWGLFYFCNVLVPAIDNAMYAPKPPGFEMVNEFELDLDEEPEDRMEIDNSQFYYRDESTSRVSGANGDEAGIPREQSGGSLEDIDLDDSHEDNTAQLL